jgi:TIR domain
MDRLLATTGQRIRIFLCHSSFDKPRVRQIYLRLSADGCEPWLDEQNLLPGQLWEIEIAKAIKASHVVLVCLSKSVVGHAGIFNKEVKSALDVADTLPENDIFIIPARLDECDVPDRLRQWHWVNLFELDGYRRLLRALRVRASGSDLLLPSEHPSAELPRFTVLAVAKTVTFLDREAVRAQFHGRQTIQAHIELAEFRFSIHGADGTIQDVKIDGVAPDIQNRSLGMLEISRQFQPPLAAGEVRIVAWHYDLIDSFPAPTESFSHWIEYFTESLELVVVFHPERKCGHARLCEKYASIKRLLQVVPCSDEIRTTVPQPVFGADYILEWDW